MATAPATDPDKMLLTPEEAESLLLKGKHVHNIVVAGGFAIIGCDYSRADAIKAFKEAKSIEIGGNSCKGMGHPLAVFDKSGRLSFFEADMDKVATFEAARTPAKQAS